MNALDTNVWLYCHDTRDTRKQDIAQRLVGEVTPMALLWQVGCEFVAAAGKLEQFGFTREQAWAALADMQTMADVIIMPHPEVWTHARTLQQRHQLHFWDALIVSSCIREGVAVLYTEDMPARGQVDGLTLINPFRA